jgi:hypothetical protein
MYIYVFTNPLSMPEMGILNRKDDSYLNCQKNDVEFKK